MSSREIAELTGKNHRNVMADIRKMLVELHGEGGVLTFQHTHTNPQNGQSYPVFNLPKRETYILMAGYSIPLRAKIIDRWQELEATTRHQHQDPIQVLNDPVAMRGLLLTYTEKVLALEGRVGGSGVYRGVCHTYPCVDYGKLRLVEVPETLCYVT